MPGEASELCTLSEAAAGADFVRCMVCMLSAASATNVRSFVMFAS